MPCSLSIDGSWSECCDLFLEENSVILAMRKPEAMQPSCGFGSLSKCQTPQCRVYWSPAPARFKCSYFSNSSVITHPVFALVFQIDIDDESLVFQDLLYVLKLLLRSSAHQHKLQSTQPLWYVGDWWLLCSCLWSFIVAICTSHSGAAIHCNFKIIM